METIHWGVVVYRDGHEILAMDSNHLSGRDLNPQDKEAIRIAGKHLLAIVGEQKEA